jgi:hypothetical protein
MAVFMIVSPAKADENIIDKSQTALLFENADIVGNDDLSEMRGAALDPEVLGVSIFDATSTNNAITGQVASGSNVISSGSFSGSQGLSSVIQNSGNNVIIQSATIVNFSIKN